MSEPQKRIEVVGSQYDIEHKEVAKASRAAAVFFVPSMLTPLYFNPDDVYQDKDKLFKLKAGATVPQGLMPAEKANDPAQLSTVLARVHSMRDMLENGVPTVIMAVTKGRPQVDNKDAQVEPTTGSLLERYKARMTVVEISPDTHKANKDTTPAASYWMNDKNPPERYVIFASQISEPGSTIKFDKLKDKDADPYIDRVNSIAAQYSIRPIQELAANAAPNAPKPGSGGIPLASPDLKG